MAQVTTVPGNGRKPAFFQPEAYLEIPNVDLLSFIFDSPDYDIDKPLYIDAEDTTRSISHRQAKEMVMQLAAGFKAVGLNRGDCVLIHSFNDIHYSIIVLGILAAGGIFTGSNPAYTVHELDHHCKIAHVRHIVTTTALLPTISTVASSRSIPSSSIFTFDPSPQHFTNLLKHGSSPWLRSGSNYPVFRLFSSGTTGLPKAADLTAGNLIAQHIANHCYRQCTSYPPEKRSYIMPLPMFHAASAPFTHNSILKLGCKIYVMPRFDLVEYLKNIERFKITDLTCVPPLVVAMVMSPLSKSVDWSSVRVIFTGAAPLSRDVQQRSKKLIDPDGSKGGTSTQVWGMTETSCIATKFYYPDDDDSASVGRLVPNLEAKLINDAGEDISAYDTPGEICVRGPTVINGYFENEEATKNSWDSDGFFKTGDVGICGKDGRWWIVERKKELIKVRSFQVAPAEVEACLMSHPGIVEAAVIGVPAGKDKDEGVRAYVVRRPGWRDRTPKAVPAIGVGSADAGQIGEENVLGEGEVRAWVRERLAKYKWIEAGVVFVDGIPKNPSGKILKRILRDQAVVEVAEEGKKKRSSKL